MLPSDLCTFEKQLIHQVRTVMLQSFVFQKILNFTYDLTKPPDGQWGSLQSDMSWTGMVGMLNRGEIDIGKLTTNSESTNLCHNYFIHTFELLLSAEQLLILFF